MPWRWENRWQRWPHCTCRPERSAGRVWLTNLTDCRASARHAPANAAGRSCFRIGPKLSKGSRQSLSPAAPTCSRCREFAATVTCRWHAASAQRQAASSCSRLTMMNNESVSALAGDERARREALDPQRSVLLQAPAGSGKTTVLVCRLLILLAHASAPEEVLAITFTRKAAAEMRARVLRALTCAAAGEGSDKPEFAPAVAALQRSRERGWELLAQP